MRVVVTSHDLGVGGTQTYALTIAEQLQRLGHETTIHADESGQAADIARDRGLPVAETESELPGEVDAVISQDAMMAYRMADRYPSAPQLFRCPSDLFDLQLAPQLPGVVGALMAVSDRMADRLRALAVTQPVIRLRQPVDTERFAARDAIRVRPRKAVLLGTYIHGERLELLRETWEAEGIECTRLSDSPEPEQAIADADIVVAKGKAALEGMACSRAVFVYDQFGCDGWVTPDSYVALESDNFAGQATDLTPSAAMLRAALAEYDPAMGMANRDIVSRHHRARKHAHEVVEVLRGLAPRAPTPDLPLRELARMVRVQWTTESRAYRQTIENTTLHKRLIEVERICGEVERARIDAERDRAAADHARAAAERARDDAERRYADLVSTRRHRIGAGLGRIVDGLRGRR